MKGKLKSKARHKQLALGLILLIGATTLVGCAEMERTVKDFDSSINGGLNRQVTVYSNVGDVIKEYQGKIDIQYRDDGTVLFELDGKRHMIKNAIVIAEEL